MFKVRSHWHTLNKNVLTGINLLCFTWVLLLLLLFDIEIENRLKLIYSVHPKNIMDSSEGCENEGKWITFSLCWTKKVMGSLQADSVQVFVFIYGLNPKITGNNNFFLAFWFCSEECMFNITRLRELWNSASTVKMSGKCYKKLRILLWVLCMNETHSV